MAFRIEHDTMGEIKVPADKYWGAQTQRSFQNFEIGTEKMPSEIITAFAVLKKAAAVINMRLDIIDQKRGNLITAVCDEILSGKLDGNFPLVVWQTGSGTQTHMNVNEVIANRANELAGEKLIHPNDHVNQGQSSNDTFPTVMHIAAVSNIERNLLPSLREFKKTLEKLSEENAGVIKVGRTHLQDATPLTFGQEVSGWCEMLNKSEQMICLALVGLRELALGGTAVGTGLNTHPKFGELSAAEISNITGTYFCTAPNKFHSLTSKDALVFCHGALKALAANLMKIANDIRLLASGPRCGIGEILVPENEPGSSIMPGKVNPTQCEAMTMVAVQVIANDVAVGIAASQGNFELNVFMPVCIYNFLQSVRLLADAMKSLEKNCVRDMKPNLSVMSYYLNNSLMLVTALTPIIGYENAAKTAKMAHSENITLKEAAMELGFITAEEFDKAVRSENMLESHE